jgi:chromosome partitioning protein
MGRVVVVVGLKGGSGKTTAAIGLASALPDAVVIDRDPQGSAWKWGQASAGAVAVVGPGASLADVMAGAQDRAWVLIDTPPGRPEVTREALAVADEGLVPIAPSPIEVSQLADTWRLIADARPDLPVAILLSRVKANTRLASGIRAMLAEKELPTMDAEVPEREAIRGAFGTTALGPYFAEVAKELMSA